MEHIHLTICLTEEYRQHIAVIRDDPVLRKCRSWPDLVKITDGKVRIELTRECIILKYSGGQDSCTYDSVLAVTELRDGILLRLPHKRLLFLPVSNTPAENERLADAMLLLCEHCPYLFRKERLRLPGVGLGQKLRYHTRPRQGYDERNLSVRVFLIALICLTLFIATMFVKMPLDGRKIHMEEAVEFSGCYDACDPYHSRRLRYIDIQFLDGQEYMVGGVCTGYSLQEKLEAIPRGTRMDLLLHPNSGIVLQIEAEGEILLAFDFASEQIWREAVGFAVLGMLGYAGVIVLLAGLLRKEL